MQPQEVKEPVKEQVTPSPVNQAPEKVAVVAEKPPEETQEQINWKRFREQREIERKEKAEAERRAQKAQEEAAALKAAMDSLLNKQPARDIEHRNAHEDDGTTSDEDRIAALVEKKIKEREQEYEKQRRQQEAEEFPQRLRTTFNDFDQVVSQENMDYIKFHHPEVSYALEHMPDGFDKWANVYKITKKFIPNTDSVKDSKKAEKNMQKPMSASSATVTPKGATTDYSSQREIENRRMENWNRMQRLIKSTGT